MQGNMTTALQLLGLAMVGDIPETYDDILEALHLQEDYELMRTMGMTHEEAYHIAVGMAESPSKYNH